jgi:hypothetical protein
MKFNYRWIGRAAIAAALLAPGAARSQSLNPSFSLDTDFDTKGSNFYGAGMFLGLPSKSAWSPYIDVYTYYLNYDAGSERGSLHAFAPGGGLQYTNGRTSVNFGAGYAFVSKGAPSSTVPTQRGGESGVTASFGVHSTGPGARPYKAEFLSNYNFGSDFLWTRARGTVPMGYSVNHPARVGLELGGQGSNHNGVSSHSFQVGPLLEYGLTPHLGFTVAGGPRFISHGGTAAYLSMSLSITP